MSELMRQILMLDDAVERWAMVKKSLEPLPQQISRDTHDILYKALSTFKEKEEEKIASEVSSYEAQLKAKVKEEMENIEKNILETYKNKKSSIITDLIHKLHGGI